MLSLIVTAISLSLTPQIALATNSATKIATAQYPAGIFLDTAGNVFIGDNVTHRLVVVPHGSDSVTLFGNTFTGGVESTFTLPSVDVSPKGVGIDPVSGALFFTEYSGKVWAISPRPATLFGVQIDQAHVNTFVEIAQITGAKGAMAFDSHGNLFIAGEDSGQIFVLPRSSTIFGQSFTANVPGVISQSQSFATEGDFLADVAFDKAGNLYVAVMFGAGAGVSVLSSGAATIFGHAVSTSAFTSITDGANIQHPCGIDLDAADRVYIGSWGQNQVFEISPKTESVFDVELTANVPAAIPSFNGLANQGIAVRPNGLVLYSGALDGTYELVNNSPAWETLRNPTSETLPNTGSSPIPVALVGLGLVFTGFFLRRKFS